MIKIEETCNGKEHLGTKKLKSGFSFWSPLNDGFAIPDKKSRCTWHQNIDRKTNPHNTAEW